MRRRLGNTVGSPTRVIVWLAKPTYCGSLLVAQPKMTIVHFVQPQLHHVPSINIGSWPDLLTVSVSLYSSDPNYLLVWTWKWKTADMKNIVYLNQTRRIPCLGWDLPANGIPSWGTFIVVPNHYFWWELWIFPNPLIVKDVLNLQVIAYQDEPCTLSHLFFLLFSCV